MHALSQSEKKLSMDEDMARIVRLEDRDAYSLDCPESKHNEGHQGQSNRMGSTLCDG